MAKKKLSTLNFLMLAGIGIGAYFLFSSFTKPTTTPPPTPPAPPAPPTPPALPIPTSGCNAITTYYPNLISLNQYIDLFQGVNAKNEVAYLQQKLNTRGECLNVDGDFGNLTLQALIRQTGKSSGTLIELL
jgi:hypothetical protein